MRGGPGQGSRSDRRSGERGSDFVERRNEKCCALLRALTVGKLGDVRLEAADPCMVQWVVKESLFQERGLFDAARPVDPVARHLRQACGGKVGPIRSPFDAWIRRVDGSTVITSRMTGVTVRFQLVKA